MKRYKIAFLILAHNDAVHLSRLVNVLKTEASDIYLHIDKKSDMSEFELLGDKCFFTQKRFDVAWADISMIDAQMELLATALNQKVDYSHLVFLSGSCYPIKKIDTINQYFLSQKEREFINFIDMRESPDIYLKQIRFKWFFKPFINSDNKFLKFIDKALRKLCTVIKMKNDWDEKTIPYFGSQWCALTEACARYVLRFHDENKWFRDMNKRTFSPDEHYIHTIVGNSHFLEASGGVQAFKGRGTWRTANYHIIDKSLAKWFTIDDWQEVRDTERLFVRKVRSSDGYELINKIDNELIN